MSAVLRLTFNVVLLYFCIVFLRFLAFNFFLLGLSRSELFMGWVELGRVGRDFSVFGGLGPLQQKD